jgi:hypothetical protein
MSVEDVQRTVAIVEACIALALERTGVDLMSLTSRLETLLNPEPSLPPRGRAREVQLERLVWVREIREGLLPASQLALAASLRASRGTRESSEDPWAELDPEFVIARDTRCAAVWTRAQLDAMMCCQRFARTSRVSFLRTAVTRLEGAAMMARARQASRITIRTVPRERERLRIALDAALEDDARAYFVERVRTRFEAAGPGVEHNLSEEQWARRRTYYLRDLGHAFAPPLQAEYDEARRLDEIERAERRRHDQPMGATRARLSPAAENDHVLDEVSEEDIPVPLRPDVTEAEAYAARCLVPVDLPDRGVTYMTPAEAASCEEELERRRQWDAVRAEREDDRRDYYARIGKEYPG